MKLQVSFHCNNGTAINLLSGLESGLSDVRLIRESLGVPDLELSRIQDHRNSIHIDPVIEIGEKFAGKSGHFEDRNSLQVTVKNGGLNGFAEPVVRCNRSPETGEVVHAWIEYRVDIPMILEAWELDGFPKAWEPLKEIK